MFRIDNATGSATPPTMPTPSTEVFPTGGDPLTSTPATRPKTWWYHSVTEELRNLAVGLNITPAKDKLSQVFAGISRMAGGGTKLAVAANTTLTADDAGFVTATAAGGNITITLPAVIAANGSTYDGASGSTARKPPLRFTFRRTDTTTGNTVTIARAGSDTIAGGTSYALDCGETVTLTGDGVSAWSIVSTTKIATILYNSKVAGTATFTVPAGVYRVRIRVWGGGGGGGGAGVGVGAGGGGGAGGYAEGIFSVIPGQTYTVTVGAGGAGGSSASGTSGGSGGTTSVVGGSISIQATGGGGGQLVNPSFAGGPPGAGTNGDINLSGGSGTDGWSNYQNVGGAGGNAPIWGGGGRAGSGGGVAGSAPGAGGGACYGTAGGGAAGAAGMVIIEAAG